MSEPLTDWFGNAIPLPEPPVVTQVGENPCIALYGKGPEGQTCQGCVHLRYPLGRNPNTRFWKCDLRTLTHGKATDHKVRWPACARYEKREEAYHGG